MAKTVDKTKSYRWLFKTNVYRCTVDAALRSGKVKTKTEYAIQLWLAYLDANTPTNTTMKYFRHGRDNVDGLLYWNSSPQGRPFWRDIHAEWNRGQK